MTHSFYVVMGGFALYDKEDRIYRPIHPDHFPEWVGQTFVFPPISEEEIKDKSKGDGLTKTIAVLQLLWFSVQLIGRLIKGWAATELEVLTFATCIMTVVIYVFWWNKPLDVHCQTILEPINTGMAEAHACNDSVKQEESRAYRASRYFLRFIPNAPVQHRLLDSSSSSSFLHPIQRHAIVFIARYLSTSLGGNHLSSSCFFPFCFFSKQ